MPLKNNKDYEKIPDNLQLNLDLLVWKGNNWQQKHFGNSKLKKLIRIWRQRNTEKSNLVRCEIIEIITIRQ